MGIRQTIALWFAPDWLKAVLNDGKRYTGGVALLLWVAIYAIPKVYPEAAMVADIAKQIQSVLEASGWDFEGGLLGVGAGATLIGWLDAILKLTNLRQPKTRLGAKE